MLCLYSQCLCANPWHSGLEHSTDPEEIDDLEKYLNEVIPPLGDSDKKEAL
jgi:hypothetical protein